MKKNQKLIIALAAGVAVAGTIAYLFATDEGKKTRRRLQSKASEVTSELDSIIKEAKQKFVGVKESLTAGCGKKESTAT